MTEVVALLTLAATLGGFGYAHWRESAAWRAERAALIAAAAAERASLITAARAERADLENRLMARDWGEYLAGTRLPTVDETPQLLTDGAEAKWFAEHSTQATSTADAEWHRANFEQHPEQYPDGLPAETTA